MTNTELVTWLRRFLPPEETVEAFTAYCTDYERGYTDAIVAVLEHVRAGELQAAREALLNDPQVRIGSAVMRDYLAERGKP